MGHVVSKNGILTSLEKIKIIVDLPRPQNVKEVQAFMGHLGYYHRFIYMYAIIAKPIYGLISIFEWHQPILSMRKMESLGREHGYLQQFY